MRTTDFNTDLRHMSSQLIRIEYELMSKVSVYWGRFGGCHKKGLVIEVKRGSSRVTWLTSWKLAYAGNFIILSITGGKMNGLDWISCWVGMDLG
ncbi:hypothetical protein HanRHA438_Chr08g0330481 [Helianthus annuus]|nr:hypothetical protein HanRHA438_Chr08g0330481 [Helianthus annuus]